MVPHNPSGLRPNPAEDLVVDGTVESKIGVSTQRLFGCLPLPFVGRSASHELEQASEQGAYRNTDEWAPSREPFAARLLNDDSHRVLSLCEQHSPDDTAARAVSVGGGGSPRVSAHPEGLQLETQKSSRWHTCAAILHRKGWVVRSQIAFGRSSAHCPRPLAHRLWPPDRRRSEGGIVPTVKRGGCAADAARFTPPVPARPRNACTWRRNHHPEMLVRGWASGAPIAIPLHHASAGASCPR